MPPGNEHLDLKFLTVSSAYKLFVNGRQLVEVGKVGTSKASYNTGIYTGYCSCYSGK